MCDSKKCSTCKLTKLVSEFSTRSDRGNTRPQSSCKTCHSAYRKAHYESNKAKYVARSAVNVKRYKALARDWILHYLEDHPCIDCGESDPMVLEFDHRGEKNANVSKIFSQISLDLTALKEEVALCDVRCANCHRRRTAKQFGWYNYSL